MIVMLVLVIVFVVRAAVPESNFTRQARISQEPQRAIHRRLTHGRILVMHKTIKILAGQVTFGPQEHIQNQVTLRSALETLFLDVIVKDFLFFGHLYRWTVVSEKALAF